MSEYVLILISKVSTYSVQDTLIFSFCFIVASKINEIINEEINEEINEIINEIINDQLMIINVPSTREARQS